MSEADFMRQLQRLASTLGARLFRQQTGMGWVGRKIERIYAARKVRVGPGDVVIRGARPFHSGFDGWSDLGGWSPLVITAEMVGSTVAVYTQVEVKIDAATTEEQTAWIDAVNAAGGRAGVAKSDEDLTKILSGNH
jgi:hypothetical protein